VSKDSDSSLVTNENFSEIFMSDGWGQVRYQQPEMAKNLPYHVTNKNTKPKTKIFFIADSKTCWVWTAL